jgi:acetolactate synthase-1/2/3 large subunit
MGAKLANPDKLCIVMLGDAGMGMVGMDLETAVRNGLGILIIVCKNGLMASERPSMPYASEQHGALELGENYQIVASGLGVWARRVETPDAAAALRLAQRGRCLGTL